MQQVEWWQKRFTKKTQRVEITIETESEIIIREKGAMKARCPLCRVESLMLTPLTAAKLSGSSTRSIYRRIEAEELHFAEMPDGRLLVCHSSLLAAMRQKRIEE